jgi:mevalonate kinase
MAAIGSGSAKLILFGEHSAVHGFAAIGAALPEQTTVTFRGPRAAAWGLQDIPHEDRNAFQSLLDRLETLLPELTSCGRRAVSVKSSVPREVGFGSSAALCSALSAAALSLLGEEGPGRSRLRTWELAHELERVFHGTPSGIDTGLSIFSGVTAFAPRPPALPGWESLRCAALWLVVGALPRSESSATLIRGIGERMRSAEPHVREGLTGLGRIAEEAKESLNGDDPAPSIGRLANNAMAILRELGLSSASLDLLLDEGSRSGALGGKLSGAGGGGAFFLVCSSEGSAQAAVERLTQAARSRAIMFAALPRVLRIGG